jgi:hypothetical protein
VSVGNSRLNANPAPSLPNDEAKVRETPESFVSECPHDPFCTNPAHTRANPAHDNAQQGAREEGDLVNYIMQIRPTVKREAIEAFLSRDGSPYLSVSPTEFEILHNQLAAKDAEIDRLTSECLVRRQEIAESDNLIRQLTYALRKLSQFQLFVNGLPYHDALGLEEYRRIVLEAIDAAERHEKGEG